MGIFDVLRDLFPVPQRNERLGPNDLPADVLNDLRQNQPEPPGWSLHSDNKGDEQHLHESRDPHFNGHRNFHSFYGGNSFPGNEGHEDEEFEDAFKQMDDMFKSFFGGALGGFGFGGFGNVPMQPLPLDGGRENPETLREKMLNDDGNKDDDFNDVPHYYRHDNENDGLDPHSHGFSFQFHTPFFRDFFESPFGRHGESPLGHHGESFGGHKESPSDRHKAENNEKLEDQDLDNSPIKPSVDDLLAPQNRTNTNDRSLFRFPHDSPSMGTSSSSFKYSTVTKKMNPDGSMETTSKKRDSDGNEEITVTRNIGEQTHTVTTKKNRDGEEEKVENFVNMDENDLQEFEGKWKGTGNSSATNPRNELVEPGKKDLTELFSSWWKPRL